MYKTSKGVYIEETDICFRCRHSKLDVNCPLIQALYNNIVYLHNEITVNSCGLYQKALFVAKN